ncbi:MAG: energy transducer TonB [Proteobacteria bacterium]|nr:energy transducer TonB [Pseudomonadota bacterium]
MPRNGNDGAFGTFITLAASVGAHLGALVLLGTVGAPDPLDPTLTRFDVVEVERVPEPEPAPPQPPLPPEPEPPAPPPRPRHRIRKPAPKPRAAKPPEPQLPEPPPADETPLDFTGVTLTSETGSSSWSTAVGSGAPITRPVGGPGMVTGRKRSGVRPGVPSARGVRVVSAESAARQPVPPSNLSELLRSNYPKQARLQGIEGVAVVRLRVMPDGRIRRIRLVRESSQGFFDACRRTLASERWAPPLDKDGRPAAMDLTFKCRFEVEF